MEQKVNYSNVLVIFFILFITIGGLRTDEETSHDNVIIGALMVLAFAVSIILVKLFHQSQKYKSENLELKEQAKAGKGSAQKNKRTPLSELLGDRYVNTTAEHVGKTTLLFMNNRKGKEPCDDSAYTIARNLRRRGRG